MAERYLFTTYHPGTVALYALISLGMAMATLHPAYLALSGAAGCAVCLRLCGGPQLRAALLLGLPSFLLVALFNPLFNHRGLTVLFNFWGNPITLEALVYGLCAGGMLLCAMIWCACLTALLPAERILTLLGRFLPTAALMLSMTLRTIPLMRHKAGSIRLATRALEGDAPGNRKDKLRRGLRNTTVLLGWCMEDGLQTADSMRARGYGAARRTRGVLHRWRSGDALTLFALGALAAMTAVGMSTEVAVFYPRLQLHLEAWWWLFAYAALLLLPFGVQGAARLKRRGR